MAYWMKDAFPDADINRVVLMCILHDLGEAFTGDIPVFAKTEADEQRETALLDAFVRSLPEPFAAEMSELYREIAEQATTEARLFRAIDGLEALIQHNESALSTWLPGEYALNTTYAEDRMAFSDYLTAFRQIVREETVKKIDAGI